MSSFDQSEGRLIPLKDSAPSRHPSRPAAMDRPLQPNSTTRTGEWPHSPVNRICYAVIGIVIVLVLFLVRL